MPIYKKPRIFKPLAYIAEKESVKNGVHHAIFTSRFDRYVGDWKNDRKEGKGWFLTINGRLYEGDWYRGYRHGFGTLSHRLPTGYYYLEYRGEWVLGAPEGVGWRYFEDGNVYFGFWKRGYQQGFGKMWYANGTYYVGHWIRNTKEGMGMFVQENGNRYEGHWENDLKHGLGRFYHLHTGQLQEGCWDDGICIKSKMTDIIIRQFCDLPTPYPIPPEELKNSLELLEKSKLWLQQRLGEIDKQLYFCIDNMI